MGANCLISNAVPCKSQLTTVSSPESSRGRSSLYLCSVPTESRVHYLRVDRSSPASSERLHLLVDWFISLYYVYIFSVSLVGRQAPLDYHGIMIAVVQAAARAGVSTKVPGPCIRKGWRTFLRGRRVEALQRLRDGGMPAVTSWIFPEGCTIGIGFWCE